MNIFIQKYCKIFVKMIIKFILSKYEINCVILKYFYTQWNSGEKNIKKLFYYFRSVVFNHFVCINLKLTTFFFIFLELNKIFKKLIIK